MSSEEAVGTCTDATVSSNATCDVERVSAPLRQRGHLYELRSKSLCLVSCCSKSSNAALTAAVAVEADSCTAICPDGRRKFNDTMVPSRGEFCSITPFR